MWSSLGDEPPPPHPRWVPEPQSRGTYGILSSCIVTLTLCVWSCLHLNVPDLRSTAGGLTLKKAKWMMAGIFTPEYMVFIAACQWLEQRHLTRQIQQAFGGCSPVPPPPWYVRMAQRFGWVEKEPGPDPRPGVPMRHHVWTSAHSYLGVMGGFAFDNSLDPDGVPFPEGRRRLTILPYGLCMLAALAPDLVPDLAVEAVRAKGKADHFAQLVACIQAIWFCAQMIARMAQHLPLAVLELVTFAHAVCALGLYGLWWNKPLDVEEPVVIHVQRSTRAAALCIRLCGNHAWTTRRRPSDTDDNDHDVEAAATPRPERPAGSSSSSSGGGGGGGTNYYEMEPTDRSTLLCIVDKAPFYDADVRTEDLPPPVILPQHDSERVEFCRDWEIMGSSGANIPSRYYHFRRYSSYRINTRGFVDYSRQNTSYARVSPWFQFVCAVLVSAAYSGWHLTAWQGPFHTASVRLLWRIAAIGLTSLMLPLVVLVSFQTRYTWDRLKVLVLFLFLVGFLVARAFPLIEGLIGLAYVPDGGFQQPNWSPYFPHLGS